MFNLKEIDGSEQSSFWQVRRRAPKPIPPTFRKVVFYETRFSAQESDRIAIPY